MSAIIIGLLKPFWPLIAGALGIVAALILGRAQGRRKAEMAARWKKAADYTKTRKVIDDESMDANPIAARERLRARDPREP